jgi:hypothetical protein
MRALALEGRAVSLQPLACLFSSTTTFEEVQFAVQVYSEMKIRAQSVVLGLAAVLCFVDAFVAPKESDPGPALTAVMGILLVRRAIIVTPQSAVVIFAGCVLAGLAVAGDHGFVNINKPIWIALMLIAGVCYALWERIEKLWS